ncbi:MAG: triose-phosphate isomerase [Actinobacteria bacterium]|nr:triose-phosphate isomerase [Actinomycetota bacterium]
MNTTPDAGVELARAVAAAGLPVAAVDVVVCPPAVGVVPVHAAVRGAGIAVGVQNVYWEQAGAFTGEISVAMLAGVAAYAIAGHSERRAQFGETDAVVNRKVRAIVASGVTPIMCVGEVLAQRDAGETRRVITAQTAAGARDLTPEQVGKLVIAYEPVWAIGTGRNATPEQAEEAIAWIRDEVAQAFGAAAAAAVRIQYGGSVNRGNWAGLWARDDIDGALVGGASLKAADFAAIVRLTAT